MIKEDHMDTIKINFKKILKMNTKLRHKKIS